MKIPKPKRSDGHVWKYFTIGEVERQADDCPLSKHYVETKQEYHERICLCGRKDRWSSSFSSYDGIQWVWVPYPKIKIQLSWIDRLLNWREQRSVS